MFFEYKNFITRALEVLFNKNIEATFGDYFQAVVGLVMLLISGLVAIFGIIFFIYAPFYAYKKILKQVTQDIKELEYTIINKSLQKNRQDNEKSINNLESEIPGLEDSLRILKSKRRRKLLAFLSFIILLYIPITIPLILLVLDFLMPYLSEANPLMLINVFFIPPFIYFLRLGITYDSDYVYALILILIFFGCAVLGCIVGNIAIAILCILGSYAYIALDRQ